MSLAPGAQLGAYRIIAILGAGGMGEVYRAHDARLGREVAIKILPDAMAKDQDGLARFEREARAVAALNHPHIVTIHSTEEDAGVRFLTMELVEGRTLNQMIPARGVPLAQFFDIASALADALSAAHQKHIIHRDLKPSNVMVTEEGRVKVLDFGLARAGETTVTEPGPHAASTKQAITVAGTILGTVPYMSPEQIEARPIDHRSDLFSLGVVMHEMATGARPFRGDSSPSVMASILRDHPPPVSELRPDMPEGVTRLVARCLELNPHYVQGRAWYALLFVMWTRGLPEEATAEARRALADDPLSSYGMTIVAFCLGSAGRIEEALATTRRAVKADPQAFLANWTLGQCLLWEGKADEAVAVHKRLCEVSGHTNIGVASLAAAIAHSSHPEEARALHELLVERGKSKYVSLAQLAITAAAAGKREEALSLARQAWDHREPYFLVVARHHLDYRWFRQQPEFAEILRAMDA